MTLKSALPLHSFAVSTKVLRAGKSFAKIFIDPLLMLQSALATVPKSKNNKVTSIFLILFSLLLVLISFICEKYTYTLKFIKVKIRFVLTQVQHLRQVLQVFCKQYLHLHFHSLQRY